MIWKYWKSRCHGSVSSVDCIVASSLGEKATENIICASRNANSRNANSCPPSEKKSHVLVRWSNVLGQAKFWGVRKYAGKIVVESGVLKP